MPRLDVLGASKSPYAVVYNFHNFDVSTFLQYLENLSRYNLVLVGVVFKLVLLQIQMLLNVFEIPKLSLHSTHLTGIIFDHCLVLRFIHSNLSNFAVLSFLHARFHNLQECQLIFPYLTFSNLTLTVRCQSSERSLTSLTYPVFTIPLA